MLAQDGHRAGYDCKCHREYRENGRNQAKPEGDRSEDIGQECGTGEPNHQDPGTLQRRGPGRPRSSGRHIRALGHLGHLEAFEGVMGEVRGQALLGVRHHLIAQISKYVPGQTVDVLLREP
jgi:hypothetical protein